MSYCTLAQTILSSPMQKCGRITPCPLHRGEVQIVRNAFISAIAHELIHKGSNETRRLTLRHKISLRPIKMFGWYHIMSHHIIPHIVYHWLFQTTGWLDPLLGWKWSDLGLGSQPSRPVRWCWRCQSEVAGELWGVGWYAASPVSGRGADVICCDWRWKGNSLMWYLFLFFFSGLIFLKPTSMYHLCLSGKYADYSPRVIFTYMFWQLCAPMYVSKGNVDQELSCKNLHVC